jgi:hypothetical protein
MSTPKEPSSSSAPPAQRANGIALAGKRLDLFISKLSIILSTPAGQDSFLKTLCYTAQFAAAGLATVGSAQIESKIKSLADRAAISLLPGDTLIAYLPVPALVRTAPRMRALSSLISDFRAFARLWGLLGMYAWAKGLLARPPADPVLKIAAWGQVSAYTAYQFVENRAYLAGKGVIPREGRLILGDWLWSSRMWMIGVGFEFVRLLRVWQLWQRAGEAKTEEEKAKRKSEVAAWRSDLLINVSNAPLTVHWSVAGGKLTEGQVGFLGGLTGWINFIERWEAAGALLAKK